MNYFEVVQARYSVRSYKSDPVELEKLQRILKCARLAPTAANRQAIKIIIITTAGNQEALQKIYPDAWFSEAPYLLCICSIPGKCWVRNDKKNYSDVDAAIVMDHIILAATALGLGTCWVAAVDVEAARAILKLEDTWEPIAFTPLGYPRQVPAQKKRKPIEDIVVYVGSELGEYKMTVPKKAQLKKQDIKASLGSIRMLRQIRNTLLRND